MGPSTHLASPGFTNSLPLSTAALSAEFVKRAAGVREPLNLAKMPNHPVKVPPNPPLYRFAATALGASMWFFLMYRAKKDGPVLLGWKHPWEH